MGMTGGKLHGKSMPLVLKDRSSVDKCGRTGIAGVFLGIAGGNAGIARGNAGIARVRLESMSLILLTTFRTDFSYKTLQRPS